MKTKQLLLVVALILGLTAKSFCQEAKRTLVFKEPTPANARKQSDLPPGTIKVKQYYIDKTEVANIHWLEFLHYKKKELDSVEYQMLLPDSSNTWYKLREHYFAPIVLISYEQAVEYCKWRSEFVSKRLNKKVTYRLPTRDEWIEIAEELIATDLKGNEKELAETSKYISKNPTGLVFSGTYRSDKNRVYHLFDNVSEMLLEKNQAMGANNFQLIPICSNPDQLITYDAPGNYLGFRCIAEVE